MLGEAGFPSLTEHQLLVFWCELFVVVLFARGLGALARRIGQPAVVGELLAGVVLGPSLFGRVWSSGFDWLFPHDPAQAGLLNAVGWVGVGLLLVLTGFETDLALMRRQGRSAAIVAVASLLIPFAVGAGVGELLPHSFAGDHAPHVVFVLFIGISLSISSLPVIAKILSELGLMRRNFSQVTLAVGMVNDLIGWLALGIVAGLAESGHVSGGRIISGVATTVVILVAALTIGQRVVDMGLRSVRAHGQLLDSVAVCVVVTLGFACVAQAVHLEAVLGAFLAGIVLGRSRFLADEAREHLSTLTLAFFAPIFFATAGLRIDLSALTDVSIAGWALVILFAAVSSKAGGAMLGAALGRLTTREGLALGAALNARGAVEVVIATVGLSLGVLSQAAYTAIVVMAIVTSVMAPPLLTIIVRGWRGTPEEQERLETEELLDRNLLIRPGRLLLPSRGGPNSIVAAQVLHHAWPADVGVTVLSVDGAGPERELAPIGTVFHEREVEWKQIDENEGLQAILGEARLGYSAIGVGATDTFGESGILSPVVDELLIASPIPLIIVRRPPGLDRPTPAAFARALVPVTGSSSARAAQELAFNLSAQLGTAIELLHVEQPPAVVDTRTRPGAAVATARPSAATGVLAQATELAHRHHIDVTTLERTGAPAEQILEVAIDRDVDLVVLGATVRRLADRPFLGHVVEEVLQNAPGTVVVVATPDPTPEVGDLA